jgi:hypothetical protein
VKKGIFFSHKRAQRNTKETRLKILPFLFRPEFLDWLRADFAKAASSITFGVEPTIISHKERKRT